MLSFSSMSWGHQGHHLAVPTPRLVPAVGGNVYLEAPTWAVLGQDADVGWVGAGTNEAGQMLVLDIPHLREGGMWDLTHPAPSRGHRAGRPCPTGVTYVLQLEQDLPRQLDALAVEVLHGHQVALGRYGVTNGVVGSQWGSGCPGG